MKLPIQRLKVRLRQMSPLTLTGMGMLYVLLVAVADTACPSAMSFSLFYLLGVTLVGWYSGSRRAVIAVSLASAIALALDEIFRTDAKLPTSVAAWNVASRLAVFLGTGWLTVEISRLTRNLERLVEERTGQWKAEAEQHKATSTRLAEALDRFEQVINNITEVFWLSDVTKNEMAYISPGYERIWGRKCADLYREPKSWAAALHPADRDGVFRRAQTDQADGSYDVEYRILRPDGAMRWIHDRAFPVRNEQGEVYRIAGLAQDITEQKRTREVLQTQAAILENMAEGVVVTNEQGVIVQMNPASERIWGYERNEMLGQPVSVFSALPEPEATAAMEEVLAVVQAAGSWRGTFKNRRKDGATIFCEATISRLEVQGHRLIVAVEQDVTERLRGQEQLQMQARVLESMAEAMLLADETGMIVLTNPALDALVGYESGELTGKPLQMLTTFAPEAYRLRFKVAIEQPRAPELAVEEYVVRRKGGALIQVEARASGLRLGDRFFLVLVGQDITERKRAEQALRQSEESLRVFLDAVPEPAMLLDREGTILLANQALAYGLGRPMGELVGQYAFGFLPARLAETRKAMFDQVVRMRKAARYEDTRAGRHFLNFESPVLDTAGNVTRVAIFGLDITKRKAAESTLARQEALYRTLFELSPNGILLEDASGNILDVNQALCKSSGYTRQELLRSNVRRFVPAEDQSTVEAHLAKLRVGPPQEHEVWNLRKSGERRLIRLNEKLITLPDGSQKILVVTSDITKRRRSELAKEVFLSLGTKLSAVRTPVEAARAIYATADHFWKWDAATLSLYSQESDWMEPVLFCDVIDGQRREVAPVLSADAPTARERRVMQEGAELLLRKEGELQGAESISFGNVSRPSASLMYVPMRREDQPIGVLSIQSYTPNAYTEEDLRTLQALADYCAGALDRIRAETALREAHDKLERRVQERTAELQAANRALGESEEKYRRLHESMTDAFVSTDMSGLITYYNPAFQALLGYTADELRTLNYKDVTPKKWHDFETGIVAKQILPRGYSDLYEKEYRHKDGTIFPVELRTSLIRDAQGQPAMMWAIVRDITERKRAEEALRRTNAILQAINQGTDNLICLKDLQGKIILANPAMSRFLGKTQAELIGTDDLDSLPDRHQAASIRENDRRIMTTGRSEAVEEAIDQPDRQWYCLFTKSPYRDESGNIIGLIGVGVDITLRKRAEEVLREAHDLLEGRVKERTAELEAANTALRESEERYRSLVNNLNVGVFRNTSEPQGRFLQTNPALLRIHGYDSVAEFQKLRVTDLYQDAGERKAFVAELLRQGAVVNYELRLKKKDGTPIYASINATIHRGPSGEPDWIDGMIEDITRRKQAEKSLRASEERYRALAESSPDAIFILDRDLKVQYVNQKGAALWRRTPKELIGLAQSELFPPEEAKLHCRVVAEVFETGQAVRQDALATFRAR
jgi:PAS domain S-box-containing protein